MAEQHTRRAAVALVLSALVAACGGPNTNRADPAAASAQEHPMAEAPVRTDLEPLRKRFPHLGRMVQAHWQGRVIGADSLIPGPSDTLIQAVAVLDPADLETISAGYTWQPAQTRWNERLSDQLRPYTPADGDWRYSKQFEADVRTSLYSGAVYLDMRSGTVYLNVYTT